MKIIPNTTKFRPLFGPVCVVRIVFEKFPATIKNRSNQSLITNYRSVSETFRFSKIHRNETVAAWSIGRASSQLKIIWNVWSQLMTRWLRGRWVVVTIPSSATRWITVIREQPTDRMHADRTLCSRTTKSHVGMHGHAFASSPRTFLWCTRVSSHLRFILSRTTGKHCGFQRKFPYGANANASCSRIFQRSFFT